MTTARIGIVSWNTAELLDRCLRSLPAALGGVDAEVVVVDNASNDGSCGVVTRHRGIELVRNSVNRGYAHAMNQALAGAKAEVLIALNPDTEPGPRSLELLVERLLAQPDVGLVTPRLVDARGQLQPSAYRFPSLKVAAAVGLVPLHWQRGWWGRRWWLEGGHPHDRPCDVDWAIGAVHVIRRQAAAEAAAGPAYTAERSNRGLSPYSERWFMYVEDLDLCWRLRSVGWRVRLEPDAVVSHVGNAAGRQAWGEDEARAHRWLAATYDWYAATRGEGAARRWALANAVGVITQIGFAAPRAVLGPERWMGRRRIGQLRPALPDHLAVLRHGSSALVSQLASPSGLGACS